MPITHNLYQTYLTRFVTVEHPGIVDFINRIGYNEIMFDFMCKNPYCIHFIEENKHNYSMNLIHLAQNKAAIHLIRKHLHQFSHCCWDYLCINQSPEAIQLLKENPTKIRWDMLSSNPSAIKLLEENPKRINMFHLCSNPAAIHLIEQRMDKIHWMELSKNPNAIHILEKNLDKVEWLSFSQNPKAINIIIEILQEQKDYDHKNRNREDYKYYDYFNKINYTYLSKNPAIFELDYISLKERCDIYRKELIEKTLHSSRIQRLFDLGIEIEDLEIYI
jgi:hypothetical protein